jgi:hypothetical protein
VSRTGAVVRGVLIAAIGSSVACGVQYDPKSATFYQGKPGGMVMTPQGPVFRESEDIPERVVFRDPDEPWRPPIGFILPKSGKFTQTSTATTIASQGIVIVLRSSDTRVPAWGGEILVRLDVHATAADGTTRAGEKVAIVLDDDSEAASALLETAVAQLGARDQIAIVDARGPRALVPTMPATHRSLALATAMHRLISPRPKRDLAGAIALARTSLGSSGTRKLLIVSQQAQSVAFDGITSSTVDARKEDAPTTVRTFLPAVGPVTFKDLVIQFDGVPSPARVLEASGGEAIWTLEGSDLRLGDVRAGDARSEILRVTIPPWIPKKNFKLNVTAHALDVSSNKTRWLTAELHAVFDNDIERIAESRNGDVIAYASALATMNRLHAAFVGDGVERAGGLLPLAQLQAKSLAALARDFPDRGFTEDAAVLQALLNAASQ